jgi:predicted lipoprotein with Yx(FWY)xxD motif
MPMRQSTGRSPITVPLAAALAALLAAAGCTRQQAEPGNDAAAAGASNVPDAGSAATPQPAAADAAAGSNPLMVATQGAAAPYVADSAGAALYALEGDKDGSGCIGDCTRTWPPMLVEGATPSDSAGLQAGMVGVVQRADGSMQVAYNGHPLYRYGGDAGAGTAGHGVGDKWGHWSLLSPQGAPLPEGQ